MANSCGKRLLRIGESCFDKDSLRAVKGQDGDWDMKHTLHLGP